MLSFSAFRAKLQQGGVPVLFLGIHCNRAAGCCCSFMVGRGMWTGCRCCSWASIATGRRGAAVPSWWACMVGGVPVLFLGIHCNRAAGCCCSFMVGVEGGRGAGAVPGHPLQQGGGVLLFLHGGAWNVDGVPVLFLGIHCNRAADHPRSSDVSRSIFRTLCPHTKRSKTLRNVTPGGKLCEILHFAPNCVDLQTVIVSDARRGRSHIPPPVGRGGGETAPSVAAALLCENMT